MPVEYLDRHPHSLLSHSKSGTYDTVFGVLFERVQLTDQDATRMVYLAIMTCCSGGLTPSFTVRRSPPSIDHHLLTTNPKSWNGTDALPLSQAPPDPSLVAVCETVKVPNKPQRGDLIAKMQGTGGIQSTFYALFHTERVASA